MDGRCMFFFDFDDTLYSHVTKEVTGLTQKCLSELQRQGHILVIASGRGREAADLFAGGLTAVPETVILMNGQIICEKGSVVYENHITLDDAGRLFRRAGELGVAYGGHYRSGVIANGLTDRVFRVWTDFSSPMPDICSHFEEKYPVYQAHLYITKEESNLFAEELKGYVTNWSHQYLVNLIHKSAGKAKAVTWCMQRYGIPRENTYAFGDGFNDVDMIEAVGHGVAMGNGFEELKRRAEYVTKASHEDGIYHALKHYGFVV